MDWLKGMNDVARHIEDNLTQPIPHDNLARMVGCSAYEFSRIFSFIAGVSVSEYIRRRRLTQAVYDIQGGNEKIIDIALKYCYESPTTFTRAFKELHGVAPLTARKTGVTLQAHMPISFKLSIKGADGMNFRVEKRDSFKIAGKPQFLQMKDDKGLELPTYHSTQPENKTAEELFAELLKSQGLSAEDVQMPEGFAEMMGNSGTEHSYYISDKDGFEFDETLDDVEMDDEDCIFIDVPSMENGGLRFVAHDKVRPLSPIAPIYVTAAFDFASHGGKAKVVMGAEAENPTMGHETIPAATWVVFSYSGKRDENSVSEAYTRILTEWFPSSGYKRNEVVPHLERFADGDSDSHPWEIWMPVVS